MIHEKARKNSRRKTRLITEAALIAAIYTVLCIIFKPISFSFLQVRIAEMLTILPYYTGSAIPGVTIGCLISSLLTGADIFDIIFGSLATFIGALGSYALRRHKYLVPLPPVISNALIIPPVLRFAYGEGQPLPFMMLTVGIGELISCYILGLALLFLLGKYRNVIFK